MANTTFTGPVRSENGFKTIAKSSTTGAITNEMTFSQYTATVTVADGATTGKESSIGIPSNFIPMGVAVTITTAATNSVTLNGVLGMSGGTTTAATATADEVEVVVSGDPGATGVTMVLKFIGVASSSDAS
jgi:hypothetical protein